MTGGLFAEDGQPAVNDVVEAKQACWSAIMRGGAVLVDARWLAALLDVLGQQADVDALREQLEEAKTDAQEAHDDMAKARKALVGKTTTATGALRDAVEDGLVDERLVPHARAILNAIDGALEHL